VAAEALGGVILAVMRIQGVDVAVGAILTVIVMVDLQRIGVIVIVVVIIVIVIDDIVVIVVVIVIVAAGDHYLNGEGQHQNQKKHQPFLFHKFVLLPDRLSNLSWAMVSISRRLVKRDVDALTGRARLISV